MRYCMHFYLKWHRNYAWSKLELRYLLNKKQTSNFDHAQFLHQLRQKFIQYLISKLQSIVKKGGKGQRMFTFLCSKKDSPVFRQSEFRHRAISAYGILSIGISAYGILSIPLLAYSILAMHVNWHIQVKTTTQTVNPCK